MTEIAETGLDDVDPRIQGAVITAPEVDAWFEREVLLLEAALMQFLQHNWRNKSDIADLRQDIYVRVYESALKGIPDSPKAFVFATARNLLIRRLRREQIVPFEAVSDFDALGTAIDEPGPDRLSRKYAYQILLIEEFAKHGVETLFVNAPQGASAEDQLLVQFQGMIAEYERAQILERSWAEANRSGSRIKLARRKAKRPGGGLEKTSKYLLPTRYIALRRLFYLIDG